MKLLLVAVALPWIAAAQPVIRVTTRLVDLSVIARDSRGPIANLTQGDFKLFDNGVERPIAFFSVNSTRRPSSPTARRPENVFTNRAEERDDAPARLTVFVIDVLNTEFSAQARVRQQFAKYASRVGARDRAALWVMSDRLRCLQDFTNDGKQLVAAIERVKPNLWLAPEITPAIASRAPTAETALASRSLTRIDEAMAYYRMQLTNDMLKDLGEALARIPGRKNVVWLSSAFPVTMSIGPGGPERGLVEGRLTGTGRALAKANVALYPIDARGLVAAAGGQNVAKVASAERDRHETMERIAAATGGRALYDTNDLAGAVQQAMDDAEVTYTIGFYPSENGEDGDYHRLRLEVKRRGVELRYREGYVAPAAQETDRRDDIHNALASVLELPGIPLAVRLEPDDPRQPGWQQMSIAIPQDAVTAGEVVDLIVAQKSADGRDLAMVSEEQRLKDGTALRRKVQRARGVARIRVVAYDRASGRVGSIDIPVTPK